MKANNGGAARASWRWIWRRCLGITVAIVVLFASMIAGVMLSAIFFQAVEL